jgi:hypothetical protein
MRRSLEFRAVCRAATRLACAVAMCAMLAGARTARARANDSGEIHWKQLPDAQLKLDGKPPLSWNVYQPEKKKQGNLVLILLGHRYLALDIKSKLVYEVPLGDLQADGKNFNTGDVMRAAHEIPSTDWSERDVGPAEAIKLKLGDYGRVLEVELPHMPDLRAFY